MNKMTAKALYKPLSLATGVLGGILAGAAFRQIWKRVGDDDNAPTPRTSPAPTARSSSPQPCRAPCSPSSRPPSTGPERRATAR